MDRLSKKEARALRRLLADITPENSNPQLQSPLFSVLPSEIRNLIFEYAVCQVIDPLKSVPETENARRRPGHELQPVIDTSLLRTCRLVYYETRAIPLRSATHHWYGLQAESYYADDWDHYLFHVSSQAGLNLHHLHTTSWGVPSLGEHLQQHLHWKRITWTICASDWDFENEWETGFSYADKISADLGQIRLPESCREVNLEFEALKKDATHRKKLRQVSNRCREVQLRRRDGSTIELDENYSMEYTWDGLVWQPGDWTIDLHGSYVDATYHVIRICWREQEAERKYMHYDHWDCLRSHKIKRAPCSNSSDDEGTR